MLTKCANPDCENQFDYREGRLVRFCRSSSNGRAGVGRSHVEHFWLCGKCSEIYTFRLESENIRVKPRGEEIASAKARRFAAVA